MPPSDPPHTLAQLLDRIGAAAGNADDISIECMMEATGQRSFGPVLLLPGLVLVSPLSGVPGIPTLMALMTALVTVQLLFGRKRFWLPQWLLKRSVSRPRFEKAIRFLQRPTRIVDRLIKPRLLWLTRGPAYYGCALLCLVIALTIPPTEMLPFAATIAGTAIFCMALSLIAHDGLLTLIAFTITLGLLLTLVNIFFL